MPQIQKHKLLYPELSYQITGLCYKVHNELKRFCRERQYADRLEQLLLQSKIPYKREFEISPGNRVDFIIAEKILMDLKAKKFILKEDYFQMKRYLLSAHLELGLIVNFRNVYLKPRRVLVRLDDSENSDED